MLIRESKDVLPGIHDIQHEVRVRRNEHIFKDVVLILLVRIRVVAVGVDEVVLLLGPRFSFSFR